MADNARASNVWSLNGTIGKLAHDKFSGDIDIARPQIGLHQKEFDDPALPCNFFGVMRSPEQRDANSQSESSLWPLAVADSYARGNDLVATYKPTDGWPYAPQVYWQATDLREAKDVLASMSLLVSVQTHLLDTHPKISVTSQVPSSELHVVSIGRGRKPNVELIESDRTISPNGEGCCVLRRLSTAPISYVEFVSSHDFQQLTCTPANQGKAFAQWHLFSEFLEKGVIRRARVHGALLPRKNDIDLAIECCAIFEHSPLPLTA